MYINKPITLLSKTLTSGEKNYSAFKYKLLAIITFCKAWRLFVDKQRTIVITNYKPSNK